LRNGGASGGYWTNCAGEKIISVKDITKGFDSTNLPGNKYSRAFSTIADIIPLFY
jgi:hypothetical protein